MQNFQKVFQIFLKFYSKLISSFLWISFRIYLKSLKRFLKIFVTFISKNFPEICTNFSKNFLKNLAKMSIKFYLRFAQILRIVYPKFPENFILFVDFSQTSITISSHLKIFTNQFIKVFRDFSSIFL